MFQVKNLSAKLIEGDKTILKDVNLLVDKGQVHLVNGRNGSGKSSFFNVVMANPSFEKTSGTIKLINESYSDLELEKINAKAINNNEVDLEELEPYERSFAGLYLANQYPTEIPGVSLASYLRLIYNNRRPKEQQLPVFKFRKVLEEKAEIIKYPKHLLTRNLNEGFSGGEKKKTEILQLLILEPRYAFLDEVDSGLDKQSIQDVFEGLSNYRKINSQISFIIITHYDKVQEYLKPDFVHEMQEGRMS